MGKETLIEKQIPKSVINNFIKKAQTGDCPFWDIHKYIDSLYDIPNIFHDKGLSDEERGSILKLRNSNLRELTDQVCDKCKEHRDRNTIKIKRRMQALIRLPEYIRDIEELERIATRSDVPTQLDEYRDKAYYIQEKYRINCPFDATWLESRSCPKFNDFKDLFQDAPAIEIMENEKPEKVKDSEGNVKYNYAPCLFNERWLILRIDLSQKTSKILAEFKEQINLHKRFAKEGTVRDKETTIDPWKVYDMHHTEGLNFSQIAKKLTGINISPPYNEEVMRTYKSVKRAYEKAVKLIESSKK